jgi:hypothetical protein
VQAEDALPLTMMPRGALLKTLLGVIFRGAIKDKSNAIHKKKGDGIYE